MRGLVLVLALSCALGAQSWQTPARWERGRLRGERGMLRLGPTGVSFRPRVGPATSWALAQIATMDLEPRQLTLVAYAPRAWHLPGLRHYRFDLATELPPVQAAALARALPRPIRNRVPDAQVPASHPLAAYADRCSGTLRFTAEGVEFLAAEGAGRSFLWRDIETLTRPDPWHLNVGGFGESWQVRLKQPFTQREFDRLWRRWDVGRRL